jgi:hypothetical protein
VIISIQNWLSETPDQSKNAATPSYMSVFMSCKSDPEQPRTFYDRYTNFLFHLVMSLAVVRLRSFPNYRWLDILTAIDIYATLLPYARRSRQHHGRCSGTVAVPIIEKHRIRTLNRLDGLDRGISAHTILLLSEGLWSHDPCNIYMFY